MNPETINAIRDALDPLLSKAGQSIDTLYQLCAIQNQVEIVNCWILIGITVLLLIATAIYTYIGVTHDIVDEGYFVFPMSILVSLDIVFVVIAVFNVFEIINRNMNPELMIWKDTINILKDIVK